MMMNYQYLVAVKSLLWRMNPLFALSGEQDFISNECCSEVMRSKSPELITKLMVPSDFLFFSYN